MTWWKKLFGSSDVGSGADSRIRYRTNPTGLSRHDAAVEFGVKAARGGNGGAIFGFGFREAKTAGKAAEATPKDVVALLAEDPEVQVYTDGTCNLFFHFATDPADAVILRLAKAVKKAGGIGFQATSCSTSLQNKLLALFQVPRAIRIQ